MENKNQASHSFLNGLILGVVIGVGITLLFTTKKGKKLLHSISEEGFDSIKNMDDLIERFQTVAEQVTDADEDEEEETGEDYIKKEPVLLAEKVEEAETKPKKVTLPTVEINRPEAIESKTLVDAVIAEQEQEENEEEDAHRIKPTRRRFFRGIPKRG